MPKDEKRQILIEFYEFLVCRGIIIETNPFNPTIRPDEFLESIKKCTHIHYKDNFNGCDWHNCKQCDYYK